MKPNGKILAWINRENWKREQMPYVQKFTDKGKEYSEYNFYSGLTKKIFDNVIEELKNSGITSVQLPIILSRSGLSTNSIRRKLLGKEETHLYELEPILKTVNYRISFNTADNVLFKVEKISPNYTYKEQLNRVIVERRLYPKFSINFNPDNPTDFEIDFTGEKIITKIGEFKMIVFVMEALETFYKAEKKDIAKIKKKIRTEIRKQYLTGEIIIKNKK